LHFISLFGTFPKTWSLQRVAGHMKQPSKQGLNIQKPDERHINYGDSYTFFLD